MMYGTNLPPFVAPTKVARKRSLGPSEYQIHCAVVAHLERRAKPDVEWFHPPNGGLRNKIEAARFKLMGVKPGVPDIILAYRGNTYGLELKTLAGRPSVEQMERIARLNAAGWHCCICHGLDRALQTLEQWGLLR